MMKKNYKIFALLLVLGFVNTVFSQKETKISSTNKKAIKYYNEGKDAYDGRKNELAEVNFLSAIARDPLFFEAELYLAYAYEDMGNYKSSLQHYRRCIDINADLFPEVYFSAAAFELMYGEYSDAKIHFEKYLSFTSAPLMQKENAKRGLTNCDFAIEALKHPVPFNPINLGDGINSEYGEYFPSISVDGLTFLYTRRLPSKRKASGVNEDFYMSYFNGEIWEKSRSVRRINTMANEGAPTLSANERLMIFTICEEYGDYGPGRKGLGGCDLFYSYKTGNVWANPKNLREPINSRHKETQPSFSADGKTLYFIKGFGRPPFRNLDIYSSELTQDGTWSDPIRLSDVINTDGMEESVYIHPDGKTLYFSSNGHPGMGGLDIFMSQKDDNGIWSTPLNLGYPINTFNDENSFIVSAKGDIAYFASDKEGGYGKYDLYQFSLPEKFRPDIVTYLKGKIFDTESKIPVPAEFKLIDLKTGKEVVVSFADEVSGEYLISLPTNKEYALSASYDGYLFFSENFLLKSGSELKPFIKDIPLQKIEVGKTVVLKNIFFDTDKFDLKEKSKAELDKLVNFLEKNPSVEIELGGHTDNVGSAKSNQILSENRAKSVYNYLEESGIDANRLTTKGYGDTMPISDNNSEKGRAENRRTEFKIIAN